MGRVRPEAAEHIKAMERVKSIRVNGDTLAVKPDGIRVALGEAPSYPLVDLEFNGTEWTALEMPYLLPAGSTPEDVARKSEAPLTRVRFVPVVKMHYGEQDDEDEDEDEDEEDGKGVQIDYTYWHTDARGAAEILCYAHRLYRDRDLVLYYHLAPRHVDWLEQYTVEGPVAFLDAYDNPIRTGHADLEWSSLPLTYGLAATIKLSDTHARWCKETTKEGEECIAKNNVLDQGCADYCLREAMACRHWTMELLRDLVIATEATWVVSVQKKFDKIVIRPNSLSVILLDQDGSTVLQLLYQQDKWRVSTSAPRVKALLARTGVERTAEEMLCEVLRSSEIRTLRAEIGYSLPLGNIRWPVEAFRAMGKISGSDVHLVRHGRRLADRPAVVEREWQIGRDALWLDIRLE